MTWRTEAPYLIYNVIVIQFLSGGYFSDTSGIQPPGRLSSVENISGRAPAFCTRGKQMLTAPPLLPRRQISSCRARPPPPLQAANRRPASVTSRQTACNRPGLPSRQGSTTGCAWPPFPVANSLGGLTRSRQGQQFIFGEVVLLIGQCPPFLPYCLC